MTCVSSGRESCASGLLVGMQGGVLRNADHRKDLLEMRLEAEGLDGLATLAGRDHHLNNKGDTTGVEIVYAGEIEKDAFDALRDSLIGAKYGGLRCAGYIARKAKKDRKSTRLNSSHQIISYAVFC